MEARKNGGMVAFSAMIRSETVTRMNEPHADLLEIADRMDVLVERGRQIDVQEPLGVLEDAANEIGKSWSGSWLGYHAHMYYGDLEPRPPGAHFGQDSGFRGRSSRGTDRQVVGTAGRVCRSRHP